MNRQEELDTAIEEFHAAWKRVERIKEAIARGLEIRTDRRFPALCEAAAVAFDTGTVDIVNSGRGGSLPLARWAVMRWMRVRFGYSYQRIGEYFSVDHGTVMHGLQAMKDRLSTDPAAAGMWKRFTERAERINNEHAEGEKAA